MPGNRSRKKKCQQQYQDRPSLESRRKDLATRMLVDIGIQYASTLGVSKTAEFLRSKNVPETVIERVLHRPQKFGKSD
ncbi:MAG: hypothetical protein ACXU7H_07025 [Burkholderiaceae bacterium]